MRPPNMVPTCVFCAVMKLYFKTTHNWSTVKPVLRNCCHERQPVLTDNTFLAEGPTFQYNWTCNQRSSVLLDHNFVANGLVFQDRFYCTHFHGPMGGLKIEGPLTFWHILQPNKIVTFTLSELAIHTPMQLTYLRDIGFKADVGELIFRGDVNGKVISLGKRRHFS